jgi:hypothetical protein
MTSVARKGYTALTPVSTIFDGRRFKADPLNDGASSSPATAAGVSFVPASHAHHDTPDEENEEIIGGGESEAFLRPSPSNPSKSFATANIYHPLPPPVRNFARRVFGPAIPRTQVFWTALKDFVDNNAGLLLVALAQFFFALVNVSVKKLNSIDPPVPTLEVRTFLLFLN